MLTLKQFGAGHRTCLGKHVSYLEIYKLVPTLFSLYDVSINQSALEVCYPILTSAQMSLVHPENEWELNNPWFVTQKGVDVKLKKHDT